MRIKKNKVNKVINVKSKKLGVHFKKNIKTFKMDSWEVMEFS